jgi:hypothetical protein
VEHVITTAYREMRPIQRQLSLQEFRILSCELVNFGTDSARTARNLLEVYSCDSGQIMSLEILVDILNLGPCLVIENQGGPPRDVVPGQSPEPPHTEMAKIPAVPDEKTFRVVSLLEKEQEAERLEVVIPQGAIAKKSRTMGTPLIEKLIFRKCKRLHWCDHLMEASRAASTSAIHNGRGASRCDTGGVERHPTKATEVMRSNSSWIAAGSLRSQAGHYREI